jgi:hypothetical protein
MFDAIPKRGQRVNTTDLIEAFWDGRERPWNARVSAMDCLRSLKRKVIANKEPFTIQTSERAGGKPIDVWIVPGKKRR